MDALFFSICSKYLRTSVCGKNGSKYHQLKGLNLVMTHTLMHNYSSRVQWLKENRCWSGDNSKIVKKTRSTLLSHESKFFWDVVVNNTTMTLPFFAGCNLNTYAVETYNKK